MGVSPTPTAVLPSAPRTVIVALHKDDFVVISCPNIRGIRFSKSKNVMVDETTAISFSRIN